MAEPGQHLYDSNMAKPGPDPSPKRRERIPSYSLFGESAHLPDVLHCETIAARSVLHEWEFEPHGHARLHQLLLLESGRGVVQLEAGLQPLGPMTLVNVPPGEIHGFRFEPGTQGYVATLAEEMRDELLARAPDERRALAQARVLRADRAVREALLEAHYLEHWKVADYARALAVTPTHLSRVLRVATGGPASRLIDGRVMREARRNLAYTNLNISTIAYMLGFADPAYFSRVFTRALGVSPRGFRAQVSA
jgi:AraC family transcriptional activator of pobA